MATIINHSKKYLFLHIPKCAGSSVSRMLRADSGEKTIFKGIHDGVDRAHMPLRVLQDHMQQDFSDYFKFAFIREPYSRVISSFCQSAHKIYRAHNRAGFIYKLIKPTDPNVFFSRMFQGDLSGYTVNGNDWRKGNVKPYFIHFLPQFDFIKESDERIGINRLFLTSEVDAAIQELTEKFDIEPPEDVLHAHKRKYPKLTPLSDETKAILDDIYGRDIKLYEKLSSTTDVVDATQIDLL